MKKEKKCLGCKHYTGIQCHGHGCFFGSCKKLLKFLDKINVSLYESIAYDDTICKYNEIKKKYRR